MTWTISDCTSLKNIIKFNECFVMFLTSTLIACFINHFTFKMESQSIAYLLIGSNHIYWNLDLGGKMHSIWDLWTNGLQECNISDFFEVGRGGQQFSVGFRKFKKHYALP